MSEGTSYGLRISYLEIYNEQLYDLLVGADDGAVASPDLTVYEDKHGVTHVKGLTLRMPSSEEDALGMLFEGETNRALAEHQLNKASTRSHCIFTLYLERSSEDGGVSGQLKFS